MGKVNPFMGDSYKTMLQYLRVGERYFRLYVGSWMHAVDEMSKSKVIVEVIRRVKDMNVAFHIQ